MIKMRKCPERPILAWTAGTTLIWGLLLLLFGNYMDTGRSYRQLAHQVRGAVPAGAHCISSTGLGPSQRAMFHYFADMPTERTENPAARRSCNVMLVQSTRSSKQKPGAEWEMLFSGARAGDKNELYQLFVKRK